MKIVTVVGARPQFIKAAVVSRAIASYNTEHATGIREVIVHTGQHYDHNMSDVFFEEMRIPQPHYHLGINDCTHGAMTGRMLEEIEKVLMREKPDVVIVYGDTNSTLAGALASSKLHIPVAHVEAGLRSFRMDMPEEINRIMTDRISDFLFCPTETAVRNLASEGITGGAKRLPRPPVVVNVGDVMYDATLFYRKMARPTERVEALLSEVGDKFYLATVHRAENTDDPHRLRNIIEAFHEISSTTPVVLPLHPRTLKMVKQYGLSLNGVRVLEPVGYFDMLTLLDRCRAVFTDSGGLQKEAYFFKKPCVTLRDETEWVELLEKGYNKLVCTEKYVILEAEKNMSDQNRDYSVKLYGTGEAGNKIIETLID